MEKKNIQIYNQGKLFYKREHILTQKKNRYRAFILKIYPKKLLNFKDKKPVRQQRKTSELCGGSVKI